MCVCVCVCVCVYLYMLYVNGNDLVYISYLCVFTCFYCYALDDQCAAPSRPSGHFELAGRARV